MRVVARRPRDPAAAAGGAGGSGPAASFGAMSSLLLSLLGMTMAITQPCAVNREIAPCTCKKEFSKISVHCTNMDSFGQVIALLQNRFQPKDRIILNIDDSNLFDLGERSFNELNMTIEDLKLNRNELSELTPFTFAGLQHVSYMSLADNPIPEMPTRVFEMMPKIKTLDIGRLHLKNVPEESFRSLPLLATLVLPGNKLYQIDTHAIPPTTIRLHLARNAITDLNGSLRHLTELQWLFLNANELTNVEDELPMNGLKITMLHLANNRLKHIPQGLKAYPNLDSLFLQSNELTGLDGALSKSRKLERVTLENNLISTLTADDFTETENLQMLELQFNLITTLNNSLLPLKRLRALNLTHNELTEFSWHEVWTLTELRYLDLSFNKISHLTGMTPNMVEWETRLTNLRLDHNQLHSLNGALSGLRSLLRLNLSSNSLSRISPDDLIGLDQLNMLDISHNRLTTLEETSKTFLPALEELIASNNYLTVLDKDFHGLPVLCWADLSNNKIVALGRDLVSKTHCRIRDGMHEDNFGTLRIYLKDNPILCDAALPEINAAMEANHTKITGVAHCPPLSEQPVTSKPNGFLGYIPEVSSMLPPHIQGEQRSLHDAGNLQDLAYPQHNQEHYVSIRHSKHLHKQLEPTVAALPLPYQARDESTYHEPIHVAQDVPNVSNDATQEVPVHDVNESSNVVPVPIPVSSFHSIYSGLPHENGTAHSTLVQIHPEVTLTDQAVYTNVDPQVQEIQISQLASEIQELRSIVQELQSENKRLSENLRNFPERPALNASSNESVVFESPPQILPVTLLDGSLEVPTNSAQEPAADKA